MFIGKMGKQYFNRKNADGQEENVVYDTETNQETIYRTEETKKSRIKKATLVTLEDVRNLLLDLFK